VNHLLPGSPLFLNKNNHCYYYSDNLFSTTKDIINEPIFVFLLIIAIASVIIIAVNESTLLISSHIALAQTPSLPPNNNNNNTQQWIDKNNNIMIQFNYKPEKPIIDSKTQMKYNVKNLTTGSNVKDLTARVIVVTNSSGQLRTFKFDNVTSHNGTFAVNYIFPDSGLYQIITRIDSKDFPTLALFNINVPFQPFGVVNANIPSSIIIIAITIAIIIAIFVVIILVIGKRRGRRITTT
jgi:hypothetical protein